ncbi:MAG: dipicolinate synthase subunit B [Firmicutes bacterium]|nr:dipicolinate synthase subunit B [Bacillota bacterium]
MVKNVFINKKSQDKRVAELVKLFDGKGIFDFEDMNIQGESIAFVEPRLEITSDMLKNLPRGTTVYGYPNQLDDSLLKLNDLQYVCLSCDEQFIRENNYLTALAQDEIIKKRFGDVKKKILIIGWGKLCVELEKVLHNHEIHVLNFNHHKVQEMVGKYGERAHFQYVNLSKFDIIINTIPSLVIGEKLLRTIYFCKTCKQTKPKVKPAIYELASAPYGFDWGGLNREMFDYTIEPALPGRFHPDKAAQAVYNAMTRHQKMVSDKLSIVLCITASSCCYTKLLPVLEDMVKIYDVIPCLSDNAATANRFVNINEFKQQLVDITGNKIIDSIAKAELLSSNKRVVASVVFPATGNTIAKLSNAITDTPVTMSVKALLRNAKPCIIGISTNDALSGQAANIGMLLARKHYYFVPFSQDDHINKPYSMVCDFSKVLETIDAALMGKQVQPIIQ